MFGMDEGQYNIVKRTCRTCSAEIQTAVNGGKKYDHVAAEIITMHHEKVATLVTRIQFIWLCGHLNNRWGNADQGYE